MKRTVVKIGKTGKRITAILGFFLAIFSAWGVYQKFATKDIGGKWHLEFKVEKSSYNPYIGETHTQRIYFTQIENSINGKGEKWEYNGKALPFDQHRKVEYTGTISGNVLKALFTLHGLKRETEGEIIATINGNTMEGTFSGTAADTKGTMKGFLITE